MIALDTNLLVYAHRAEGPWHARARELVERLAEGPSTWAIPWPCVSEFLGVVTNPRVWKPPTPLDHALEQVDAWSEAPNLAVLSEGGREHWPTLRGIVVAGRAAGPRVHDARIAAICLHHGVRELWTADRDFSRFPSLRQRNPLVG